VSCCCPYFARSRATSGRSAALHIFEPRYKEMIAECLEGKKPFGIVRASEEGSPHRLHRRDCLCHEKVRRRPHGYPHARVNRFEVLEVNEERSFLRAEIAMVPDDPSRPAIELIEQACACTRKSPN